MRSLTSSEVRVIHALLIAADVPERRREVWSGVPRATYLAVRKRAFSLGWLTRRFVPDPVATGFDSVELRLEQPFSDRLPEAIRAVRELPGLVLLWTSPETLISVRFVRHGARGDEAGPPARTRFEIRVDDPFRELPVYFDFEGAWSTWASGLSLVTYPTGAVAPRADGRPLTQADREGLKQLLSVDGEDPIAEGELRLSESFLPPRHQSLVRRGVVRRRVFPNLAELPPMPDGAAINGCVFVHGTLRSGADPAQIVPQLLRDGPARPFLAAFDERSALLGLLSPRPARLRGAGRPTLDLLAERLEGISVIREPVATLHPAVDHRYGRLFADADRG
jgi:hypothetical protein